jgi:hypothetical protein
MKADGFEKLQGHVEANEAFKGIIPQNRAQNEKPGAKAGLIANNF